MLLSCGVNPSRQASLSAALRRAAHTHTKESVAIAASSFGSREPRRGTNQEEKATTPGQDPIMSQDPTKRRKATRGGTNIGKGIQTISRSGNSFTAICSRLAG